MTVYGSKVKPGSGVFWLRQSSWPSAMNPALFPFSLQTSTFLAPPPACCPSPWRTAHLQCPRGVSEEGQEMRRGMAGGDHSPMWPGLPVKAYSKLRVQAGPVGPSRGVRTWASVVCCPGDFTTYRYSSEERIWKCLASVVNERLEKTKKAECSSTCADWCGIFKQGPTLTSNTSVGPAWAAFSRGEIP